MNYKNYLEEIFSAEDIEITDEINYSYDNEKITLVIKYLSGSNFKESIIQPIQLSIYATDVGYVKSLLDTFSKTYNNVPFSDGLEYVNQLYSTPFVLNTLQKSGTNYISQLIVTGTLIISDNISDIKKVYIDGEEIETTMRILSYMTSIDNQKKGNAKINKTNVINASVKLAISVINKGNEFCQKMRNIRTGLINIDTEFVIKLIYTDNDAEETYTMKLNEYSINSENQLLPSLSLVFSE